MSKEILLAVSLQQGGEFTPYDLAARDVAVALAKGGGAKLSVLNVYDYDKVKEPSLSPDMAARYREDQMHRMDMQMETKLKAFLADVQGMEVPVTTFLEAAEPRKTIVAMAERLRPDLLVIGAHSKRSVFAVKLAGTASYVSQHAPCPVVMVKP